MKKTGLGKDPLSWIKPTTAKKEQKKIAAVSKINPEIKEFEKKKKLPKFTTFDVKLTVLLRDDQLDYLDRLARTIKKNRSSEYRAERITKNTLIRAFIDAFSKTEFDTSNISDEKILLSKIKGLQ